MTILTARDHTALRLNLTSIVEMYLQAEIAPADAVADVVKLCHADEGIAEHQGFDSYVAKILTLVDRGEVTANWGIEHLVAVATAKNRAQVMRPEFA